MRALLSMLFVKLCFFLHTLMPLNLAGIPPLVPAGPEPANEAFIMQTRTVLTSAQILALFTTPITLVPAPGLGFHIVPFAIILTLNAGSVAYLDGGGGAVSLAVGSLSAALANNNIFLVTVAPNRRVQQFAWPGALGTAGNAPTEDNAPLNLTKATANFTAGNGTMAVTVLFTIQPSN